MYRGFLPVALVALCASFLALLLILLHTDAWDRWLLFACGTTTVASLVIVVGIVRPSWVMCPAADTPLPHSDPPLHYHVATPSDTCTSSEAESEPLTNQAWINLIEECVNLFEELDQHQGNFDPPRQELALHVLCRLRELLERSGVETISDDSTFDRNRHQPERKGSRILPDAAIAETLSPGFAVDRLVLRRARVRLAEGAPREYEAQS